MMVLLDTDVAVDIFRVFPPARAWLRSLTDEVVLPGYVAMELVQGCRTKAEQARMTRRFRDLRRIWPGLKACEAAYDTYARYHLSHSLGMIDSLVAQCALEQAVPLYTFKQKHFRAVPGLRTIQPYRR